MKKIKLWFQSIIIKEKIKECERLKLVTGKQQFLLRLNNGKLKVVNSSYRKVFNHLIAKGKIQNKQMTLTDLIKISLYHTK